MDETLQESEPTAEGGHAPSEDVATAEAEKAHTAQFAPVETPGPGTPGSGTPGSGMPGSGTPGSETPGSETPGWTVSPAQPEDDGFPGGPIPDSSGFSWRLPGQPVPVQHAQGGIPNEFDHLFRDAPADDRRSLMPNQGTIGVAVPGAAGYAGPAYPQNPATSVPPGPGSQPTQALPPAEATGHQAPVYQPPTQAQVGYGQQQLPSRAYDQGGYQAQAQAQGQAGYGPESHTQAIPRVQPHMYGGRGNSGEPDLLLATGPDRRQSNRTLLVAVGVFVVLIVVAAVAFSGGGGKSKSGTAGKSATTDSPPPSTSSSAPPGVDPEAKKQADAIFAIIAQSHELRSKANGAYDAVQLCQNVAANKQAFTDVATSREAQADGMKPLAVDKLPGGAKLQQDLITSWQLSAESERDYANWANDNLACKGKPGANDNLNRATSAGDKAGTAKSAAVNDWNAFASRLGEQTIKVSDL